MAWDLDGSTQYFDCIMPAAVKAAAGGPFTMIAFCELDDAANGTLMCNMSGSSVFQVEEIFTGLNYGTSAGTRNGPAITSLSPSGVGTPYIYIISKNTGNVAPEYTVIPWVSGAPGTPVSGTITGGGATLGDGSAPGASGFIRCGQYGTATGERLNGKVIALAQYTAYKDATARAALDSWNDWLAASGLAWAMEFTALTTRTDASGNGGDETARNGTSPYTLTSDPANFFPSGSTAVNVADVPAGARVRSGYESILTGVAVADSPQGIRLRSPEGSGAVSGVQAAVDVPAGVRARSGSETIALGVAVTDLPAGIRLRGAPDAVSYGSAMQDAPAGVRVRSGYESVVIGGGSVTVTDDAPSGIRLRSASESVLFGHSVVDLPNGWRFRSAPERLALGLVVTDVPAGYRLRSGAEAVDTGAGGVALLDAPAGIRLRSGYETLLGVIDQTPSPTILAPVSVARAAGGASIARVLGVTPIVRITAAVRRFRA